MAESNTVFNLRISLSFLIEIGTVGIGILSGMAKDTDQHTCEVPITLMESLNNKMSQK